MTQSDALAAVARLIHREYVGRRGGFLVSAGVGAGRVVLYCRRDPLDDEKRICEQLADGVPLEWKVTGDMRFLAAEAPLRVLYRGTSLAEGDTCPDCARRLRGNGPCGALLAPPGGAIGLRCTRCGFATHGGQG